MDIRIETLESALAKLSKSFTARIALFDDAGVIISADGDEKHTNGFFKTLAEQSLVTAGKSYQWMIDNDGRNWWVSTAEIKLEKFDDMQLHLAMPRDVLLQDAQHVRNMLLLATLILTSLVLFISRRSSKRNSDILQMLAGRANSLVNFNFDPVERVKTNINEIAQLQTGLERARTTLSNFLQLLDRVSREEDLENLLPLVLQETSLIVQSENASIYILADSAWHLRAKLGESTDVDWLAEWLALSEADRHSREAIEITIGDAHALMLPLLGRRGDLLGLLIVERSTAFDVQHRNFIKALSGFAALTLESKELITSQKQLFESFIKLLAGGLDAKSPHTGGHCNRVPILTEWLVEMASASTHAYVADFSVDADMREAVHIASWLHDCGKIVTPEYVADKATKLETIYNRIHEVRMRYEVCKRDAEISLWNEHFPQGLPAAAKAKLAVTLTALDEDFAFVAECNVGSEKMSDDALIRLKQIASTTWTRTIDDRLGLSREEMRRLDGRTESALPAQEFMLSDKPEHKIPRAPTPSFGPDKPCGFKLKQPELLYDRGEVKNLSIQHGTLTEEERYKINEHIVLTIRMLEALPFPRHLVSVPEIAGGHHERMDGRGYPRGIPAGNLSVPARLMAIADVFEALTATDRPYKQGKSPEEALAIMRGMAKGGHLDQALLALFADSDIPARYAAQFLSKQDVLSKHDIESKHDIGGSAVSPR